MILGNLNSSSSSLELPIKSEGRDEFFSMLLLERKPRDHEVPVLLPNVNAKKIRISFLIENERRGENSVPTLRLTL